MTAIFKFASLKMKMKPCCRILHPSRNLLPNSPSNLTNYSPASRFHTSAPPAASFRLGEILGRRNSALNSSWGQSRIFSTAACCFSSSRRGFSASVESRVNDKNFDRVYVQGGVNLKPPPSSEAAAAEDAEIGRRNECASQAIFVEAGKEETEAEKEAWKLLRNAVVTYCGSPVGTVAANDPNDKTPLNYDQVFIRDFVPSSFAFLLKGEGEIVRNFLLHTLQLQVALFFP